MPETEPLAESGRVWERCWCYRYGRCLTDCPTADLPKPMPMTDDNWVAAYAAVLDARRHSDGQGGESGA